jgi:asparagine synthase (glutamine-hydrolysing)
MSVQAGIWNLNGAPIDPAFLRKVSESTEPYAPDGSFWRNEGPLALLYRPFHTTSESRRETQPYVTPRGFVLTWDGRIDNRSELIRELPEYLTPNSTDVSIAGASFDHWDVECFRRIIGDWAVSIWSPGDRRLILARDYAGIRQLYFIATDKTVMWCTNLETLVLASPVQLNLNEEYIAGYLFLWPKANLSPYQEIRPVPPASFVQASKGRVSVQRYWNFNSRQQIKYGSDAEYEEHFRYVFHDAVRRRLRSDTPILAELSGGLDSSSIVCVADDIITKESGFVRLDTTSRYDSDEPGGDERVYFSRVEKKRARTGLHIDKRLFPSAFPLTFHEFVATPGSMGNRPPNSTDCSGLAAIATYKVLLSGTAGDEVTGGIPDPGPQLADLALTFHWCHLARQLVAWSLVKRKPWVQLLNSSLVLCLPLWLRIRLTDRYAPMPWLQSSFVGHYRRAICELEWRSNHQHRLPTRRDYAETIETLSRQMAFSAVRPKFCQERRYPYLDQSLVEFLFSIPADQLLRPGQRRSLMRRSLAGLVPNEVLTRPTKAIGGRIYMTAFQNQWQELRDLFVMPICSQLGYVDGCAFLASLHSAKNGNAPHLVRLLRAIALEIWLQDLRERGVLRLPDSPSSATRKHVTVRTLVSE